MNACADPKHGSHERVGDGPPSHRLAGGAVRERAAGNRSDRKKLARRIDGDAGLSLADQAEARE